MIYSTDTPEEIRTKIMDEIMAPYETTDGGNKLYIYNNVLLAMKIYGDWLVEKFKQSPQYFE